MEQRKKRDESFLWHNMRKSSRYIGMQMPLSRRNTRMGVVIRVNNHGTQEIPNGSVTHWNADLLGRTGEDVATPGEGNVQIRV